MNGAGCLIVATIGLLAAGCANDSEAWRQLPPPTIEGRDAFYDVARVGDSTIIVIGKQGKILRSEDNGETWTRVPSGLTDALLGIAFSDQHHGAIVGANGSYLETADGGRSWTRRALGVERQLSAIRFQPDGTGFIVGEFGTLLRTANAGKEWQAITLDWEELSPELLEILGPVEPHLDDVEFCEPNRGWGRR